jgi:phosphomevalonate kinase
MTASRAESASRHHMTTASARFCWQGGYLVLESPMFGLVIAVDKRLYYCRAHKRRQYGITSVFASDTLPIAIQSPQFRQEWKYLYQKSIFTLTADESFSTNDFVERRCEISLLYLLSRIHIILHYWQSKTILRATTLLVSHHSSRQ